MIVDVEAMKNDPNARGKTGQLNDEASNRAVGTETHEYETEPEWFAPKVETTGTLKRIQAARPEAVQNWFRGRLRVDAPAVTPIVHTHW